VPQLALDDGLLPYDLVEIVVGGFHDVFSVR
jgi:hypothetical protein